MITIIRYLQFTSKFCILHFKNCMFYNNDIKEEHIRMGPVPVFASCGISPSPYLSFKRICLIFKS